MSNQFDNIPSELRACKQWVNFKLQSKILLTGEIKYTKPPVNALCNNIDITDQKNYLTFNDAVANLKNKNIAGIGFVFNSLLGAESYVGIDLDNVVIDGEFTELATDIVNLMCSYSEMSISGTGVHIIVKGKINKGGSRVAVGKSKVEVYRNNAYFTFSGVHIPTTPTTIETRQNELKTLYNKYFKIKATGTQKGSLPDVKQYQTTNTDNQTYLENGIKFGKRLNSFLQGYRATGDESQNDYILLIELAYWCNKDIDLMLNAFYHSNYFNQKDNDHKKKALRMDYINSTAKKAINNTVSTAKETEQKKRL